MQKYNTSPSVSIFERDLSLTAVTNTGTNVFVAGFTNTGVTDEVLRVSTRDELESIYGTPTNSAERYFYYTVRELLNSPAQIYTYRLPYGESTGEGFGSQHTALVYPVLTYSNSVSSTNLDVLSGTYMVGKPVQVTLSDTQYNQALEGTLFTWSATASAATQFSTPANLGSAGIIVLDKAKTAINSQFEGFYVGIADNVNINPATSFDAITKAYTVSLSAPAIGAGTYDYTQIPNGTLEFNLAAVYNGPANSISQIMEKLTDYNIDGREDDDLLNLGVFRLRKSLYATEAFKLDYVLDDAIVGSIDSFRTQLNPNGGPAVPFFLEAQDTNSRNVEILVNPYIANKFGTSTLGADGKPLKKVRVLTDSLVSTYSTVSAAIGVPLAIVQAAAASIGNADALFPLGSYSPVKITQKVIGNLPTKINRALESVINDEIYDIDVVVDAGLSTVFSMACAANTTYYDDTLYNSTIKTVVDSLRTSNDIFNDNTATGVRANCSAIFNQFENFCNLPSNTGGRGDCIFIADPLRHIVVTGKNTKILSDKTKNFQKDVYWAMRHQFELENTSYAATYGNWVQVYDEFTGEKIWAPFSGFAAAVMARSDANDYPWSAPAGFNRGLLTTSALDLAINPNQKQRDELYKSNINPVMFSAAQGMVIFGQKTMQRKPSAFDRINVRRLFQYLERPTKKTAKYFLFEPNNPFTQNRFKNTLDPIFKFAKENGGMYDYVIIVDERVNTPSVIDANEMRATIGVQSTKTCEYILVEFVSTPTGSSFKELI